MKWRIRKPVIWLTKRAKVKLVSILLGCLLLVCLLTYQPGFLHTWKNNHPLHHQIIVLDPGHGGYDAGAVSAEGIEEKKINLQIARKLQHYLQQAGATVYLTRETDEDLVGGGIVHNRKSADLANRYRYIQSKKADMLLTIHLNAMQNPRWRGAQTFFNEKKNENNKLLATFIQEEFIQQLANTTREPKAMRQPIYLLRKTEIPTVLVECGFLSNPIEATLLSKSNYQTKIAASIYRAVLRYSLEVGYNGKR